MALAAHHCRLWLAARPGPRRACYSWLRHSCLTARGCRTRGAAGAQPAVAKAGRHNQDAQTRGGCGLPPLPLSVAAGRGARGATSDSKGWPHTTRARKHAAVAAFLPCYRWLWAARGARGGKESQRAGRGAGRGLSFFRCARRGKRAAGGWPPEGGPCAPPIYMNLSRLQNIRTIVLQSLVPTPARNTPLTRAPSRGTMSPSIETGSTPMEADKAAAPRQADTWYNEDNWKHTMETYCGGLLWKLIKITKTIGNTATRT